MAKLITKEIASAIQEEYNAKQIDVVPFVVPENFNLYVGPVKICASSPKPFIYMDDTVTHEYLNEWQHDVGKLVIRDFNKGIMDRLYELRMDTHTVLLRLIQDDELEEFGEKGFRHLEVGNPYEGLRYFTIIRIITGDKTYGSKDPMYRHIHDFDDEPDPKKEEKETEEIENSAEEDAQYALF